MLHLFKKQKEFENITQDVASLAEFLINDTKSDLPTPLKEHLEPNKLDYSLESLKLIDVYLDEIRTNRNNLSEEQLVKVVARCGAYCGEVIRKLSNKKLYWISYDTAAIADPRVTSFDKSLYTQYILFSEPNDFSFPFAKVGKYLDNGPEDSLYFFALMILSPTPNQEK